MFDPSAAYDMCISYRPDCEVISGDQQRFPDAGPGVAGRGESPQIRMEYVPVSHLIYRSYQIHQLCKCKYIMFHKSEL